MSLYVSLFGNALYIMGCIAGISVACYWLRSRELIHLHRSIVKSWCLMLGAYAVDRGYWAVARMLAPENETHHPTMLEHGYIIVTAMAILFVFGMIRFITTIKLQKPRFTAYLVLSIFFTAALFAVIAHP